MKKAILRIVFLMLLAACSENESSVAPVEMEPDTTHKGMVKILSTGSSVVLGTNNKVAPPSEKPEMEVSFDYDFSIGAHEVTCSEFNDLMSSKIKLKCEHKELPATSVTFFDAVLFSNAKSKSEKLDTSYTYSNVSYDSEGHCIGLEGYAFHPEKNGYRLPTEAEWNLVAQSHWFPKGDWTSQNSKYKIQKICTAESDGQICNMAGNAMEWVNDWKGLFSETKLSNFVGAPDGGGIGERVVKGGSYQSDISGIHLYSRSDVYTVTSSTKADYVGFRLAMGAIPNAIWMGKNNRPSNSRHIVLANSSTLHEKTGSYKTKLVFRNDVSRNLAYIDFSSSALSVVEIVDTLNAYHPDISPDGKRVAFCTGLEGNSSKSSLYVRNLDKTGSGLIKLDVESAAIPRWRVLPNSDTVIVYVSNPGDNKDSLTWEKYSTWQVKFSRGKFGTPNKLFDGSFHGGISSNNTLAVSGSKILRATIKEDNDRYTNYTWYNGEQACNVSLAKDQTNRVLFLDFGGKTGRNFAGVSYGTHQQLLIADSTGKLQQSIPAPKGYTFDHSEWSAKDLVVVTLATASNGVHEKIALVDTRDSSVTELVQGEEIWHPCLWVKEINPFFDILLSSDSAGVYLTPDHSISQAKLSIKMEKYWKYLDSTEILAVGSSRMEYGFDPELFPKRKMLNIAMMGTEIRREFYIIDNYVYNHAQNLKALLLPIDIDYWDEDCYAYLNEFSKFPGYIYDANHGFWAGGLPENFIENMENSFKAEEEIQAYYSKRGSYIAKQTHSWKTQPIEVAHDSMLTPESAKFLEGHLEHLQEIIGWAAEKKIVVIGIIFPQAPDYKKTGSFGLYGLQRSVAKKKIQWLDSLAQKSDNFYLMDENKMGDHDYTDDMASDRDHLNKNGAKQLTTRLNELMKNIPSLN